MVWHIKFARIVFSSVFSVVLNPVYVLSQTIPDSSLGKESSTVNRTTIDDNIADLIEGGAIRASNLFHSFSEFNIGNGEAVYFANPEGITNILTRVTGDNITNIFGTLGVNGAANLFLLNPNGIVFGENSALDTNGSFFATTADSYIFGENDAKFSASEAGTAPLLNIDLTPGLQMGINPEAIIVEGKGHMLVGGEFFPLQNQSLIPGLQINAEQTLGLIAGEIELDGGIIQTAGGQIELAGVKQGKVYFNLDSTGDRLDLSQVNEFGNLKLFNKAMLDSSGVLTGDISLTGSNISLEDAATVTIQNWGDRTSGKITVNAANSVKLIGAVRNAPDTQTPQGTVTGIAYSRIIAETLGLKNAGDISIKSQNLSLSDGGHVDSRTFSNANTGNINLDIEETLEVNSYSPLSPSFLPSVISTTIFASGNAEEIDISARNISFLDGGSINSINFGAGEGGKVKIDVEEDLIISGISSQTIIPSSIASISFKTGDSGSLSINAARISILDRGAITTSSFGSGSAGQLTVNASEHIKIASPIGEDSRFIFNESGIISDAPISDPLFRQATGAPDVPSGNSGNILLNTPTLIISDGAKISVGNQGLGDSGNLQVNAERIFLEDKGEISAFSATGQGGNIELNLENSLLLEDKSSITAENTGTFTDRRMDVNGGNISIDAETVTLLTESQINADAFEGDGGNINITTQGLFVSNDSSISASSEFGLDGSIEVETINAERYIELDRLSESLPGDNQKITKTCSVQNSKLAIAGRGGLPENPGQSLRGEVLWQDLRLPTIQSNRIAEQISIEPLSNIIHPVLKEVNRWETTPQGNVRLLARDRQIVPSNNTVDCAKFVAQ